jgi:hypothetical protein
MTPGGDPVFQGKRDKFMARLALDGGRRMFRSLAGSLFPSPEVLKQLYGDRRNRMLPVHYSRFMKWRAEEWRGTA